MDTAITYINNIAMDWSTPIDNTLTYEVTNESVQSSEVPNISTHIRRVPSTMEFEAAFTGEDREAKYSQLENLVAAKSLVTLVQYRTLDNLVITELQPLGSFENVIRFRIQLTQVNIAYTEKVVRKSSKTKSTISKVKKKSKAGKKTEKWGPGAYPSVLWLKK